MIKNNQLKSEFKKALREIGESSTSHGIPNILKNENILIKLLWFISMLISYIYCFYGLTITFKEFLNYEVVIKISDQKVSSIEFPTVTFCNNIPFDLNKNTYFSNESINGYLKLKDYYYEKIENNSNLLDLIENGDFYSFFQYQNFKLKLDELDFNIEDMLVNCRFNNMPCNKDDFSKQKLENFRTCYSFNSGKNNSELKNSYFPGKRNSLQLELFVGYANENYDLIRSTGANLFIHNSTNIPKYDYDSISLSTGFETDIILKPIFTYKKSKPYSSCILDDSIDNFESDFSKKTKNLIGKYQQRDCIEICQQQVIIEKCNCFNSQFLNYELSIRLCNENDIECYINASKTFYNSTLSAECYKLCPEECNKIEFDFKLSYFQYPTKFYSNLLIKQNQVFPNKLRNFQTHEQIKSSVLAVNIYYDDMSYRVIEELPAKTIEQLIADIGGYVGLCLGVSLLTFIEIIECVLKSALIYFEH